METTDFCSYELSKRLKDCGFDEPCDHLYNCHGNLNRYADTDRINRNTNGHHTPSCSAPTLAHAQKWLREKKGIAINVIAHDRSDRYVEGKYHWSEAYLPNFKESGLQWADWFIYGKHPLFDTYEEALSDGLNQMLQLIEKGE